MIGCGIATAISSALYPQAIRNWKNSDLFLQKKCDLQWIWALQYAWLLTPAKW
jgi:hypothetical protein